MTDRARPMLHLICGLPGAGKSWLARSIEQDTGAVRFTPDEWLLSLELSLHDEPARAQVEALIWRIARAVLLAGADVILENGFWRRAERDAYRATARRLGATTRLHFLDVPLAELQQRVAARNLGLPAAQRIDPHAIKGWAAAFEAPTPDELAGD